MPTATELGTSSRKVILFIAAYQRTKGQAPTWAEIRKALNMAEPKFVSIMRKLKAQGFVTFEFRVERSTSATDAGLRAALLR